MHEDFEMTFDLVSGVDEIVMKYGEAVKRPKLITISPPLILRWKEKLTL